ncbi:hypothetical protein EHEL_040910 [Encephalitozoon hellem ATCC 50504]|uniref:Uncharacterized protein n=1 Tax=Encephalitozoon hellem TaxID=27973 RepID=A0A9Q9C2P5_ENCHE|nr:uncharacterized protein EHEL_040910 [Encephalitozoon hellem ATCC 50504]AFM98141.1 hypothetical protein EHEL_040910 [Encephalitozoon hellem ATCC 50504]UTX42986.1 hypothetical protein GPU96_04g07190 [Encephalitozoon hellem]|eukprot:XP_003887122.1 hypothetical protein EHEL_040910 [Encephalitozoon hellem ATCC 50504]
MTAEGSSNEMIEESSITISSNMADNDAAIREAVPSEPTASEDQRKIRPYLRSRLWIKKDADYDLDPSYADRILDRFIFHINALREGRTYERDIREDAFYYKYTPISVCDIETIRGSSDLQSKMGCKRLREISLLLVDYCMKFNRDGEDLIDLEVGAIDLPDDTRALVKETVMRKKRIVSLLHKVRNHIGEIILMGEKCHNHIEKSSAIAFKEISSLEDQVSGHNE